MDKIKTKLQRIHFDPFVLEDKLTAWALRFCEKGSWVRSILPPASVLFLLFT